jgi:predicted O-linked N-acetylglucosamine transferase (SPINDLY family)
MRQLDESIAAHRQAVALRPNLPEAFNNLGLALADIGQVEEAIAAYRHAIALRPNYVDAHNNLLLTLHYHPAYEAGAIAEEHRRWNPQHAEPLRKFIHIHSNDRDPDRPLRVGYVSADFRWHSVSCFFENLLAFHDRQWVQTYCYCDVTRPDATTVRLQQQAANWRNIAGMRDEAVGELVRQDQIDILVDLSGHTGSNRLLVFARKPAPIQITYLGYPDTTGMPAMDYRLTDEYADPPGQTESLHSEQLVRLPRTFLCYRAPDAAPAVGPSPVSRDGHVIFGSFNALAKVNAPLVRLWSRILREVPDSRIVLKSYGLTSSSAQQWVLNLFAAEGIGADRVEVHGWQPDEGAHFQLYGRLDIALDTFPYHGTTTTCEAMWMGVPTITLAGRVHVSRVGVSLLNNVGLPGLVAHSQEEYVRIASELGNNHSHLSELRSTLRQRMEQSPLMDATKFARDVEAAYRRIWHTWAAASAKR